MKQFHELCEAPHLSVGTWRCAGHNHRPGPEQASPLPTINLPLRGSYRRHAGGHEELVDPMVASFSPPGEGWRTSHDTPGGDVGLYVRPDPAAFGVAFPRGTRHISAATWRMAAALAQAPADAEPDETLDQAEALVEALLDAPPLPRPELHLAADARALVVAGARRVDAVAATLGVTPRHLCRAFRASTGTTLHAWVDGIRLREAASALDRGCGDLAGLAVELGYASHSHLTARFRRHFGVPPRAWRAAASR